jgi:DNA-binding PucR family transcriptional regulator
LRDRHLVRLDTNNLDRINIEATGQPKIVLARKEQNWTIASRDNQPANGDEVRRLLDTLNQQQVTEFVADTASDLRSTASTSRNCA